MKPAQITPGGPSDSPNDTTGLAVLADQIHSAWADCRAHAIGAWDGYIETGRLLSEARRYFPGDRQYGQWFAAQSFGFSSQWGRRLRLLAENESDVRRVLDTAVTGGGVNGVLAELGLLSNPQRVADLEEASAGDRLRRLNELWDAIETMDLAQAIDAYDEIVLINAECQVAYLHARAAFRRELRAVPVDLRPSIEGVLAALGLSESFVNVGGWPA